MSEAILLSFVALILGVALAELCLSEFNAFLDRELTLDYGKSLDTILVLITLTFFIGIISGSYPALFLSSFHPVLALKGGLKSGKGNLYTRRVLVMIQFVVAVGFAIMAHITAKQLDFVVNQDLGFNQENVLVIKSVPREWNFAGVKKLEMLKQRLTANPEILSASISWAVPGEREGGPSFARLDWDENQAINTMAYRVDEAFLGTFDLQLVEGRFFSKDFFHSDTTNSIVLNQAAVKAFGWESAAGKSLKSEGRTFNVIGVVKDFNQGPLYHEITPLVLRYVYGYPIYRLLSVKFRSHDVTQTVANIEKIWKNVLPHSPFEYSFMTDLVKENYKLVTRRIKITSIVTVVAIFVACLGLLGLISFIAERSTKEIGIRKVLGATVANIVSSLSQEFFKLVLVANLIAWPLIYFYMNKWLQDWAYRIEIDIWMFLLPGALAMVIALLTVSTQAIKAALANPVEALRYE
jgi:putative ABC transport system permease protein